MTSLYVIPEFPSSSMNILSWRGIIPLHGPNPWTMFNHPRWVTYVSTLQSFHTPNHFGDLPSGGITFPGVDVANATVVPTSGIYLQDLLNNFDELDTHLYPPSLESTPYLSPVPSPFSDAPWGGDIILPTQPTTPAYTDPIPRRSTMPATPQPEPAWHAEPGRFDKTTLSYFIGNASLAGQTAPNYGADYFDITGLETGPYLPEWSPVPGTVLGKRSRDVEGTYDNDHQPHPNKKAMEANAVLESRWPSNRAHHKSATRTPTDKNQKSKTVGCGAGKLVATTAQEVSHQYLLGPSVQQVLMWPTAPEKPTWVEGSAVEATQRTLQDPPRLKERHRALLAATQADWERAAVDVLKCRLCPDADFSDFEDFKRHCDTSEAHPLKISFCSHCGDFFARGDALKRHYDKPPGECVKAVADKADLKRRETVRAHKAFEERLARWLKTGEEIGLPFAHLIKEMFPNSSKKGTTWCKYFVRLWRRVALRLVFGFTAYFSKDLVLTNFPKADMKYASRSGVTASSSPSFCTCDRPVYPLGIALDDPKRDKSAFYLGDIFMLQRICRSSGTTVILCTRIIHPGEVTLIEGLDYQPFFSVKTGILACVE
ncbi:hypothetical protein BGW80DRAFT_1555843 [Lactifluus volemus]|nr:hypothetical protein BGW80DRAFT_1555843 [Lactifluus volemus]